MFTLFLVFVVFNIQSVLSTVGCGRQASSYEPILTPPKTRVINGFTAKPHSWPWTLSYQMYDSQKCGATLLRVREGLEQSDIALTASHCVHKIKPGGVPTVADLRPFSILAGDHAHSAFEKGEQQVGIIEVHMHQNFSNFEKTNDLAILKLAQPISFSNTIRPVCLPQQGDPIAVGQTCVAAGWGRIDSDDERLTSDTLQQLVVEVHDQNKCFQKWVRVYNKELMTCAGAMNGSSSGDSGGPLVCQASDGRWVLQGVANFVGGMGGCNAKQPPVYARVSKFVDWINEKIQELTSLK